MKRPLKDVRPVGPFAQRGNGGLELVVFTNVDIPQSAADDILEVAENEMGREFQSVAVMDINSGFVIDVGPEILLEHEEFKTYEDMISSVVDKLNSMDKIRGNKVEISEITARCD